MNQPVKNENRKIEEEFDAPDLYLRLVEEFNKVRAKLCFRLIEAGDASVGVPKSAARELVDVANLCMMLATRIDGEGVDEKEAGDEGVY